MEENSGTSKKLRADTSASAVPAPGTPARRAGRKAKHRTKAADSAKNDAKSEPMRVIEGGARKRSPDIKDHIGQQLKAVYDDILKQPVPARFTDLLRELASKSKMDGR